MNAKNISFFFVFLLKNLLLLQLSAFLNCIHLNYNTGGAKAATTEEQSSRVKSQTKHKNMSKSRMNDEKYSILILYSYKTLQYCIDRDTKTGGEGM